MISVVITLYNKATYIKRAINSVLNQTFQNFECIVVDDGSTDGGGKIVREFNDQRIRLITQENAGVSAARNKGIELARHPLIAFLDADDEWMPDFLAASLKIHQEAPDIVASFTNYRREPEGEALLPETKSGARVLKDYFAFCLCNQGVGMCSSAVMICRDTLLKIGGFPVGKILGEDLDTWVRLAWSGPVAFIPDILSIYHCTIGACAQNVAHVGVDMLPTYNLWQATGRVSQALARSSAAYVYLFRFYEVFTQISLGEPRRARTLLFEVPWPYRFSTMFLCAYLGIHFPSCSRYIREISTRLDHLFLTLRWHGREH